MTKKISILSLALLTLSCSLSFAAQSNKVPLLNKTFSQSQIQNLEINLVYEDVEIKNTYGDEILVEVYSNHKKRIPNIAVNSNTLQITSQKNIMITGLNCTVKIYIPENQTFKDAYIKTTSSDINIEKMIAQNLEVLSTSGDIECKTLNAEDNLKIHTTSGDIEVDRIETKELTVKSTSGDAELNEIKCETFDAKSTSGEITVNAFSGDYIGTETTSGEIDFYDVDVNCFSFETTSGSVSIDFKKVPEASSKIKTVSGNVQICLPHDGFTLDVYSSSGTFKDKINDNRFTPRSNYTQKYFGGGSQIEIKTTSGEILLEQ